MSQFLDSIKYVTKNYKRYDDWEQNQADDVAKRRYLSQKLDLPKDKVELTRAKANGVFRASDIMDKRSEDNCANMEQATTIIGMATTLPLLLFAAYPSYLAQKGKSMSNKQSTYFNLFIMAVTLVPSIGLALWGTTKQKEASRIGRFQAKQNELKDAKNFVIYTPEQIEAAKILTRNMPDKNDKKSLSKTFADMKQMSRDEVEYKKWLKQRVNNDDEIQKILNTKFTPEQLARGEEDKEIIVNIVKDVNMNAETYSENVENAFDTINMMSMVTNIPIYWGVNKIFKNFKNISPTVKQLAPVIACSLFTLPILFWSTHEKKQGSRIGRFVKRQEILDNPELIMAYSDDQLKLAKDVKAPKLKKGFFEELKENFTFFGKYLKERKEYTEYKKTTEKENAKIYEALKQTKISEKQLKEAKNLQEKTFRTFDKIDEMSQRYSEDTEAATEITKQLMFTIFPLIGGTVPIALIFAASKGKLPLKGIINTISKITLKKDSSLRVFINKAYEIINNDSELKKDFSKIFVNKKIQEKFIADSRLQKLYVEFELQNKHTLDRLMKVKDTKDTKEVESIAKDINNEHFKQDTFSKWIRNLSGDIFKLWANKKYKINSLEKSSGKSIEKIDPKKFYNDYKTLCNSVLLGGFIPIIGIGIGIPWAISSLFTNIQLKAGRIGIMKAMEEIDNPKLFVNEDNKTKNH